MLYDEIKDKKGRISVNLTTTKDRLHLCSHTIWSIVHQTRLPDQIVIWISSEPYMSDAGITDLPEWSNEINNLFSNILKFEWTENTGPYRKILPALRKANENDILIYADDDTAYGSRWLEKLLISHESNSTKVIATRVRQIRKNILGRSKSYYYAKLITNKTEVLKDYIITGVGGAVIQKKHINPELLEMEQYKEICPKTDDLWISKILQLTGTPVLTCPEALSELFIIQHPYGLKLTNNSHGQKAFSIIGRLFNKVRICFLGWLGIPINNNDRAYKKINVFFKKLR